MFPPRNTVFPAAAIAFIFALAFAASAPNGGGSQAKRAGAPDDGDGSPGNSGTCYDVGCHNTFPLNSGSGTVGVNVPAFYALGDTITVEVFVDHLGAARHGFQITARDKNGQPTGEWLPGSTSRLTIGNPNYVTQKLASSVSSWTMQYAMPKQETAGDVTLYFAGNGADGRFNAANDHVYTGQATVALSTSAAIDETTSPEKISAVYPNPASETVTVSYASRFAVDIAVYDTEGRLRVRTSGAATAAGTIDAVVDVSDLPVGIYFVRLRPDSPTGTSGSRSGGSTLVHSLVVQR